MRQLTRDQIIAALGGNSGITKVLIGERNIVNIYPEKDMQHAIHVYLIAERKKLDLDAIQNIARLTNHPTLIVEISLPEKPSITDGLVATDYGLFADGYNQALRDIRLKEM